MRISKDNVINAVCIFGIIITICFMLIVILKSFYGHKVDIAFIKDIFSIAATLAAALIAISLFNDWKEQHNKTILAPVAMEIFHLNYSDIKCITDYSVLVKNALYLNVTDVQSAKVNDAFTTILKNFEKRIVSIQTFSKLSKNEKIRTQLLKYVDIMKIHQTQVSSKFKGTSVIDKVFQESSNQFVKDSVDIIDAINESISDYIIVK